MPVTREPTAVITDPAGGAEPRCCMCSTSGSSTTRNPSTLARIHPGRSTTAILPPSPGPGSPVSSRTGSCTAAARLRSSATTFLASAMLTAGPGRAHRDTGRGGDIPVDHLRAAHPPTVRWPEPDGSAPGGRQRSAAAAARQGGGEPGQIGRRRRPGRCCRQPVGHEREREQLTVPGLRDPGQRHHGRAGCRSWPAPRRARPGPGRGRRCRPGPACRRTPPPAGR